MKNVLIIGTALVATFAFANEAQAASVEASAGAKIIAPLEISKKSDLYFGTIAPSVSTNDVVSVAPNGSRNCGPALTCLTADNTAASFGVTGEMDNLYTISLPGSIQIANGAGNTMQVYDFLGSKPGGVLAGGADTFNVGGKLAVAARQPAGRYTGNFVVTVEYQ